MTANHCKRTCRDLFPLEPDTWCDGCKVDEAEDREANMRRWQEARVTAREIEAWILAHGGQSCV